MQSNKQRKIIAFFYLLHPHARQTHAQVKRAYRNPSTSANDFSDVTKNQTKKSESGNRSRFLCPHRHVNNKKDYFFNANP